MHYLVKEWVISPSNSRPVGLSAYVHLNHWLDVVARQLAALDDTNTNLEIAIKSEAAEQTARQFMWLLFDKVPLIHLCWQIQRIQYRHRIRKMFLKKISGVKLLALMQNQCEDVHISESPTGGIHLLSLGWVSLQCSFVIHVNNQKNSLLNYSGTEKSKLRQYLEVLRLIGQRSVPLTAETDCLVAGSTRLVWWSGSSWTSTLSSSVHVSLRLIGVFIASWGAKPQQLQPSLNCFTLCNVFSARFVSVKKQDSKHTLIREKPITQCEMFPLNSVWVLSQVIICLSFFHFSGMQMRVN